MIFGNLGRCTAAPKVTSGGSRCTHPPYGLTIDNTAPDDTITVSACDFEGGFSVNGTAYGACGVGAGGSMVFPESGGPISFTGSWIDLGLSGAGSRTIYFLIPGSTDEISDIFSYDWSTDGLLGTIIGSFTSDFGGSLGLLPAGTDPGDVFVADGSAVGFGLAFLSGSVLSLNAAVIPEPGTLALLSLSLLGLAVIRRGKRHERTPLQASA